MINAKFPPFDHDPVNKPVHYRAHPSGVECIQITEHMSFTLGNAVKYIWRADHKNGVEDLRKAVWYLEREIARRASPETIEAKPLPESVQVAMERAEAAEAE